MSLDQLKIDSGTTINDRYVIRESLGRGGAGVVFSAEQLGLGITRAIKFLSPAKPDRQEDFQNTFRREIENLSQLTHRNVVKVVDYQVWQKDGIKYPYFVMELANGELDVAIRQVTKRDDLIDLLDQLLDGLQYIHDRDLMHGDIKPRNILYHDPGGSARREVKIGDLGVSKLFGMAKEPISTTTSGMTLMWGTKNYAAPEIRSIINRGQPVEAKWLKDNKEKLDLFSLGATIADLLSTGTLESVEADHERIERLFADLRPNIRNCLNESDLSYLRKFVWKLTEWDTKDRYQTVSEAHSAFLRMTPRRMAFGAMPELTGIGCTRRIYHDRHQVLLSEAVFRWVNHPVFQRLHHQNQLGLLYNVYPGARQSRFAHSLETFETARNLSLHLLNNSAFRFLLSEENISLFLTASLLHDVGHYPLAHSLEELRPKLASVHKDEELLSVVRRDYEMAKDFLQRPFDDVPPPQNKPLWNVLEDDNIDPESLVKLINRAVANEVSDAEAIMQALLDGPLDVDKMAYLRYDSQATSMPYGAGVDSEGLFTSLMVLLPYDYPELNHAEVGLSSRGISAAESIITARYHMYGRVYWHRTNRAIMAMLSYAFRHLMDNKVSFITFRQYIQETFRLSDWEAVRWLSSQFSQAVEAGVIKCESNRPLKNLLPGIADGTRRLHKQLVAFSGHRAAGKLADCHEALVGFDQRQIETIRVGVMDLIGHYADDVTDDEVLIDVPHSKRKEELYVRVVDEQTGELHSFSDYSQIAQAVKEQYDSLACPSRIFVSPRLAETMRSEVPKVRQEIAKLIERR